jgi:hypothetical protein
MPGIRILAHRLSQPRIAILGTGALALVLLFGYGVSQAGARRVPPPTFARDVMPILQEKCQVCHRPGSIAPMALMTYEDAVKAAPRIRGRVMARTMPPWHISRSVGIQQFKNDRSLSDAQIQTMVEWIDGGTPRGEMADMPAPVTWPDDAKWQMGERFGAPDLVLKSAPFNVQESGQDKWWRPSTPTGLTKPRWVRAIEIKPSLAGRKAVHHVLTTLQQNEGGMITGLASTAHDMPMSAGLFMEWAVGKTGEIFADSAGKLMLPGSNIRWEVHYYSPGVPVPNDEVELGIWFYPETYTPKYRTILRMFNAIGAELDIPPNSRTMVQNFYVMPAPGRLENFQPHMHMRGKAMSMEAVYPDGRREVLSMVDNFQWRWHVNYIYADDAAPLLPKGTTLVFTAWHDNTTENPNNPDPRQWVGYGDRTVDEMAHVWVDVTYLEQEDFDRMTAARRAKAAQRRGGPGS